MTFGLPPTIPPPAPCELVVVAKRQSGRPDVVEVRGDAARVSQLLDTREVGAYRVRVRVS